jgi:hypothetical protein
MIGFMINVAHGDSRHVGRPVVVVGLLVALCCLAFATVNVLFEATDYFADGPNAEYAAAISVANWLVTALKIVGAAAALLSIAPRPWLLRPPLVGVLVWGSFATLAVYAVGAVVEAAAIAAGVIGDRSDITVRSVAYVLFFCALAAGFGVLATSYRRRYRLGRGVVALGLLGAPTVLGLVLVGLPSVLTALGVMPDA